MKIHNTYQRYLLIVRIPLTDIIKIYEYTCHFSLHRTVFTHTGNTMTNSPGKPKLTRKP